MNKSLPDVLSIEEVEAFGHRIVNAGEKYFDPMLVTDEVLELFRNCIDYAPIHMPGGRVEKKSKEKHLIFFLDNIIKPSGRSLLEAHGLI